MVDFADFGLLRAQHDEMARRMGMMELAHEEMRQRMARLEVLYGNTGVVPPGVGEQLPFPHAPGLPGEAL